MPRLPRITAKQMEKVLSRLDFYLHHQKGSHARFLHPDGRRVTLFFHSGEILKPKTLKSILVQTEISVEELIELL
jgi:predicted RNA binding protein YcfA (HicA-like mRNA interferase family)